MRLSASSSVSQVKSISAPSEADVVALLQPDEQPLGNTGDQQVNDGHRAQESEWFMGRARRLGCDPHHVRQPNDLDQGGGLWHCDSVIGHLRPRMAHRLRELDAYERDAGG